MDVASASTCYASSVLPDSPYHLGASAVASAAPPALQRLPATMDHQQQSRLMPAPEQSSSSSNNSGHHSPPAQQQHHNNSHPAGDHLHPPPTKRPKLDHHESSPPASSELVPPAAVKESPGNDGNLDGPDAEGEEDASASAQYITANCVVVTYFSGEISRVVDEHFSRALNGRDGTTGNAGTSTGSPSSAEKASGESTVNGQF